MLTIGIKIMFMKLKTLDLFISTFCSRIGVIQFLFPTHEQFICNAYLLFYLVYHITCLRAM